MEWLAAWDWSHGRVQHVKVDRLCRVRSRSDLDESPFDLDDFGFLRGPGVFSWRPDRADDLLDPVVLSEQQSFALLGEPGSGKTTALKAVRDHWVERLGSDHVSYLNAISMTEDLFKEMVGPVLTSLPPLENGKEFEAGPVERVVILDQLDESPALLGLAGHFALILAGRDTAGLRMIVACRQMNYPPALDSALRQRCVFGAADLAPLTREQAMAIAEAHGVSGEDLTHAAAARGVTPLASVPLTLEMLCEMFIRGGDLVGTPVEIFRRAVSLFADKLTPRAGAAPTMASLGREQRLAVARRLAARLLLTGRRNLWTGDGSAPRDTDLDFGSAAGGIEGLEAGRFEVTQQLVQDTIGCALFAAAGPCRVAFRHSSIAAFLAAEHLLNHRVPQAQLRQLLLVEQSFGDTWLTIPTPLRELAAWLIALQPERNEWLLDADPLSLSAHSALVDSSEARRLLVIALIRTADEAYLSDSWWRRRGSFQLKHPGLGDQVLQGLQATTGDDWRSHARTQLLLELAFEAADPVLGHELTSIAFNDDRAAYDRRLAVQAFAVCCPQRVGELVALLDRLHDAEYASHQDADDELRAALLNELWPKHLGADAFVSSVTARQNRDLYGGYARFLWSTAARGASDEQVREVVKLLAAEVAAANPEPETTNADGDPSVTVQTFNPEEMVEPRAGKEFVASFIDRALAGSLAYEQLPSIAAVLAPYFQTSIGFDIPASLDEERSSLPGEEVPPLRRALALALTGVIRDDYPAYVANTVLRGWRAPFELRLTDDQRAARRSSLLGSDDFGWLATEAQRLYDTDSAFGLVIAELAGGVLDPANEDDYELAFTLFELMGQEAPTIAAMFTAIGTDSRVARVWRKRQAAEVGDTNKKWEKADDFASETQQLLDTVEFERPELFWRLAWRLQFDPRTGQGHDPSFDDDLLSYPAISVLGDNGAIRLGMAARAYLEAENDERESWLGANTWNRKAWAGYLALCVVDRNQVPPLDIPWESWVGAIIWFLTETDTNASERQARLLQTAITAVPEAIGDAFATYIKVTLERGAVLTRIDLSGQILPAVLGQRLLIVLRRVRMAIERQAGADITLPPGSQVDDLAVQAWRDLAVQLVRADVAGSIEETKAAMTFAKGQAPSKLALAASAVLMSSEPAAAWPIIRDTAGSGPITLTPIACAVGQQNCYSVKMSALDDSDLVAFYLWLCEALPQSDDVNVRGAHFVGSREDAQRLRGHTLDTISQRSTRTILDLLRAAIRHDDAIELVSAERKVRAQLAEISWMAPTVADLAELINDSTRRLVRSDNELARLLIETLQDIAGKIPAHGELLWDRVPAVIMAPIKRNNIRLGCAGSEQDAEYWSPKPESALSAYLANQLELRLVDRRVVVNREVLIKPTNAYGAGNRTDLLVQVSDGSTPISTVPVEIKGNWNRDVEGAITTQLTDRYLPDSGSKAGVYVVGWYPPEQWNVKEYRRSAAAKREATDLLSTLSATAATLSQSRGLFVSPFLLLISRPVPS